MGEVYRARDTKLQRDVAIKVLPEAWARDPERLARLEREAQILASLNHPHIAAIHGLEDTGAVRALVLEFVEGPTLAELIGRGGSLDPPARAGESENSPLPVEEALSIARQIVDAVEAAHEQGIVHRDLKPANVKVRPDGTVKVLDFGLAKAVGGRVVSSDPHESPTVTLAATQAGLILGTAAYMSPEQASGKQTDKRTDIWSFGVVLWELLTGAGLFTGGETTSHVLADVLRAPIDFTRIPQGPLRDLLRRCLDRDVKTRLRDIGEARVALARATSAASVTLGSETEGTLGARGAGTRLRVAWTAAAILALTTAVALWAPWRTSLERPLMRLDVDLGAGVALPAENYPGNFAISPDGTRVLYVASVAGSERLRKRLASRSSACDSCSATRR
jgi:serine/threonine-protein kinase